MKNSSSILVLLVAMAACNQAPLPGRRAETPAQQPVSIPATVSTQRRTPVVQAVHNVLPSVVNIQTEATIRSRSLDPWFGFFEGPRRSYQTQSLGSGFVWTSDGLIVTNAHVVQGASRITVNFQDGTQLPAQVIGVDPDSDLAVLQVRTGKLVAAPLGTSSDLLIGEPVIAVGNPFGLTGSVTTGVVSATGRSVPSPERGRTYTDFIQTDASINPGNSGGPLLNIEGKVIGINVAIYAQAQGIGFAIPVDRARKVIEDLRRFGEVHRVYIGAVTSTVTPEEAIRLGMQPTRGALVTRVFADSPADRAGLRDGDVITAVGNAMVDSRESFATVTATAAAGSELLLRVLRDGSTVEVKLRPVDPPRDIGLQMLREISGLEVAERRERVFVTQVDARSRAAEIGLEPGDLIVGVNGVEVTSLARLNDELARSTERSSVVLDVARGRFIYSLTFPMGR
jgi:serine protease Do